RADEPPRNPVHLVGEGEGLLLEACAVAGFGRDPACFGLGARLTHRRTVPLTCTGAGTSRRRTLFPLRRHFGEAGPGQSGDDLVAARPGLVPLERDLAHEIGVRVLDPLVRAQGAREASDAAL